MSTIGMLDSFYLPVVVFAFCTAFFLVLLWSMLRRPRDRVTAFEDGNGKVTVSRRALEDIIARSCEQFDEIVRAKVSVRTRNDKIRTEIQLRLKQSARVRDFSKQLRARITDILTDNLGMEDVGTMEFIVGGIVAEKPPPKTTDLEHEAPPEEKK
ncbi:MAG: alkaline shock response membrane anchor protein AmaP [Verrucomicrobia bacterium]|nr:MAG: alkaline shock response membrane anchor protein AmaP [Verrucomicrobiota bacterium]